MGREPEPRPVLSPEELRALEAAMAVVLPSDDGPGASDANAIGYVEWLVSEGRSAAVVGDLKLAAALLDTIARGLWHRPFAACAAEEQELAMQRFEGTPRARVQQAYATIVKTTLAGFLCPPE
jgi:gluconate 2-dehydrogenase subunit 3-like protein